MSQAPSRFITGLAKANQQVEVLETNFTTLEVGALQTCWKIIEAKVKQIAKELTLDIYTENPEWVDLFRYDDGRIESHTLIYHPLWLLNIYSDIIKSNLERNYAIAKILEPILKERWFSSIPIHYLVDILEYVKEAVRKDVQNHLSATIESAFDKLNAAILNCSRVERRNTITLQMYTKKSK